MNKNKIKKNNLLKKYFNNNLLKNKKLKLTLMAFEEILKIKKNIKKIFNTTDPLKIKNMIGKKINDVEITEKDFQYSELIEKNYENLYKKCKKILKKINEN